MTIHAKTEDFASPKEMISNANALMAIEVFFVKVSNLFVVVKLL